MDVDVVLIVEGGIQVVFRSFSSSSSSIGSGHGRVVVRHGWTIVDVVTWPLEETVRFGSVVMIVDVGEEDNNGCGGGGVQNLGGSDAKDVEKEEEDTTTSTSPSSVDGDGRSIS